MIKCTVTFPDIDDPHLAVDTIHNVEIKDNKGLIVCSFRGMSLRGKRNLSSPHVAYDFVLYANEDMVDG